MKLDMDEKVEGMCGECKEEIKKNTCTRCGKAIEDKQKFETNKSFDEEKFKAMAE